MSEGTGRGWRELVASFAGLPVLVLGEAMLDAYLHGDVGGLEREAPVPAVQIQGRAEAPGGAGNTAVNVHALGGDVRLLSVIGDDEAGELLRASLEAHGVGGDDVLTAAGRRTPVKHRVLSGGNLVLRFDEGDTGPIDEVSEQAVIERLRVLFPRVRAVIVSDYACGLVTPRVIEALAALQARSPRVLMIDAKDLAPYRAVGATAVKPNAREACRLLALDEGKVSESRPALLATHAERLLKLTGAHVVAATMDTDGALIIEHGREPHRTYARPAPSSDAVGAGDTFVSALTLALAAGADAVSAGELASAAAAVAVVKQGTARCFADELLPDPRRNEKYLGLGRLVRALEAHRAAGRRTVLASGCFDLLHRGHISLLSRAKALGDVLVVGLNADESVRRVKGAGRPLAPLDDRAALVASISCVDHVVAFDEDSPEALIQALRPDIVVKGPGYERETLPERALVEALGGAVRILDADGDWSTVQLVERIRESGA